MGYLYKFNNDILIAMELRKKYPFNIPQNIALFNILPPEENSIHFGSSYPLRNPKTGLWNNINIRGGIYLKDIIFNENNYIDYGITLGLGIEYLGRTQSIDFALRAGNKESIIFDKEYEKYFSFHIGMTTGERWFMKRRRK